MRKRIPKGLVAVFVIFIVIAIDQTSKIWVKTNMALYDSIEIAKWFKIYFAKNETCT